MKSKTTKLKLKKEVIARLSSAQVGGVKFTIDNCLSRHCEAEPFTTKLGYCKETFGTECLCGTDGCTGGSLGGGCPSKPITNGCMHSNHCGSAAGVCLQTNDVIANCMSNPCIQLTDPCFVTN